MHFFVYIIQLLVVETNRYYHQYLEALDEGQSPLLDVIAGNVLIFSIILQMGHDIKDTLQAYWSTAEHFSTPFYVQNMKRDRLSRTEVPAFH
jgi:hypothetical protein